MDQNGGHLRKMEIPLLKVLFGLVLAMKANLQGEPRLVKQEPCIGRGKKAFYKCCPKQTVISA
jgi:hypothetical protein